MPLLQDLIESFERRWPLAQAESWDTPGLVAGDPKQTVARVLLCVDVTAETIQAAIDGGFDLLFAHHPFLMRGVNFLGENTAKGAVLTTAIRAKLAIYAAHTNADIVQNGVSDVLAKALGIVEPKPLVPGVLSGEGAGRIGLLSNTVTLGEFAMHVARSLPATATGIRVSGNYEQPIKRVALCGGAGDSYLPAAIAAEADLYLSSDLRHHVVQDAREQAVLNGGTPAIIDVSHWAAEWLWLEQAAIELLKIHSDVEFEVCDLRTDPWDFVVTQ